jgi:glycine cleavage system protein P-like pyridoxal-binding family
MVVCAGRVPPGTAGLFHAARCNEPLIMELSSAGERGVIPPPVEDDIANAVGDVVASLPAAIRRKQPANLPELSQPQVLRHYLRLSQMCMGADITLDMMGTCTIKYSPKLHEHIVRQSKVWDLHPLQDEATLQGVLEIIYRFERMMCEISGLDASSFQAGSGAQGIYTNACIIDLCQFNLHKTFGAPHGGIGQACAAVGASAKLAPFLPGPVVTFDGESYHINPARPDAIHRIRAFFGNIQTVIKSYAWVCSLGADGLKAVAETAVLNNNYLAAKISRLKGVGLAWPGYNYHRLEQVRYSMQKLYEETGVTSHDVMWRMVDYGLQHYMLSHHPMLVPEPFTIEPGESYSIGELDEYVDVLEKIIAEAYATPDIVKSAPHRASVSKVDEVSIDDPQRWAFTYRGFKARTDY